MLWPVGKSRGLTDPVIVDPIVVDIGLVGEGWPSTQYKGVLLDGFHGLGQVNRQEAAGHFLVRLSLGVMLLATKVAQVSYKQLAATHATTVIV